MKETHSEAASPCTQTIQCYLFLGGQTLSNLRQHVYVLIKILKFCTGSSAKSYQCKFGIKSVLANRVVAAEELGKAIQEVIHYQTLRGKFSSVHPELRREGIVRVDVGEKGLHFIRETGDLKFIDNSKSAGASETVAASPTCELTGCGVKVGKGGLCTRVH